MLFESHCCSFQPINQYMHSHEIIPLCFWYPVCFHTTDLRHRQKNSELWAFALSSWINIWVFNINRMLENKFITLFMQTILIIVLYLFCSIIIKETPSPLSTYINKVTNCNSNMMVWSTKIYKWWWTHPGVVSFQKYSNTPK